MKVTSTGVFQLTIKETIGSVLYAPLWWYTAGLKRVLDWVRETIRYAWRYTALGVWIKNIFVPMYGETQISGRIISVLMRIAMIFFRGLLFVGWSFVVGLLFVFYLSVPVVLLFAFFVHLVGIPLT